MKKSQATLLLVAVGAAAATDTSATNATCFLLKNHEAGAAEFDFTYKEPEKPFPSLTQCYKNNQGACCVSAHDAYIESKYAKILSSTCLRQFPYLEQYYCLGCNPDQGKWVVGNDYTIETDVGGNPVTDADGVPVWNFDMRICKSFMNFLYDPSQASYNYDKCGLLADGVEEGVGYLPTSRYFNASQFINDIKPPYFEHVNWVEIDDEYDSNGVEFDDSVECVVPEPGDSIDASTYACCFSDAGKPAVSLWLAAASVAAVGAVVWPR